MAHGTHARRRLTVIGTAVALGLAAATGTAQASGPRLSASPSPIDIGSFGGSTFVNSLDNDGEAVGYSFFGGGAYHYHAFEWKEGTLHDLGSLAGPDGNSTANAINDADEIVGFTDTPAGTQVPYVYRHGQMTQLGDQGDPLAINDAGVIVGFIGGSGGTTPVLWRHGTMTPLPVPADCLNGRATAITENGTIIGDCLSPGFARTLEWKGDYRTVRDLGTGFSGTGVNNRGLIAGTDNTTGQAAIRHLSGTIQDLGFVPGFTASSTARAITDNGNVAGTSRSLGDSVAFRWCHGTMTTLATPAGTSNATAETINAHGQVAGEVRDATYISHAVIWP
ncbi:MAG: hypothetical protein HOW97_11935 [Catenulispora sp.]|nr:hypothetical protein [Catenulispora sp.]